MKTEIQTNNRTYGWENFDSLELILSERRNRLHELWIYDPNGREYAETKAEIRAILSEIDRRKEQE